jgi:SpoVK/Ycf46/Vps4 family AAA+-type ATPase
MLLQEVTVLPLLRPDLFRGVREPPSGVLLYGPPGTGKTMLAKAVAAESGATFIPVTGSVILSKWFGQSEANVRQLFQEAQQKAPSVIFIDEVDSVLGKRGVGGEGPGGASEASRRVTNEFLSYMDGIQTGTSGDGRGVDGVAGSRRSSSRGKVVVIAATNAPWELDEAALSRFAARVLVPLPDVGARTSILQQAMGSVACEMSSKEWGQVAEKTAMYSGRDLMQICR